jgi:archaellum component FlaG (FlaF/FlaG flagellin family)
MMDKAITTSIFITVGMILALMLFNVTYPAAIEGSDAVRSMSSRIAERMRTHVTIIHAVSELDADGNWQDVNSNGVFEVTIWVKNVGETRINPIESMDVFFGTESNFARIPHESNVSGTYPRWGGTVETNTDWNPSETLRVAIQYSTALPSDRYYFKLSLPNGVTDEYFLGI